MPTAINRKQLAERWDVDVTTIDRYEREGIIARMFQIGQPKYSLVAIETIEAGEIDNKIVRLMRENAELRKAYDEIKTKLDMIKRLVE